MRVQPIVYVTNMDRAIAWYSILLAGSPTVASEQWTTFELGGGTLALHLTAEALPAGSVELSLVSEERLEAVAERASPTAEIEQQPFGRSLVVVDPDGTNIQVNEHRTKD